MRGPSLLVVGGGSNGLWIARRCRRAGWGVTRADAGPLPNPAAASWDQHRLIHPLGAESETDVHAIEAAMGGWAELWSRLGHSHYRQTGGLLGSRIEARAIFLGAAGWPCQRVGSASLAALVPGLRRHPENGGLWTPRAGVLLADRIVTDMVRLIDGLGCRLLPHRPIFEEEIREGRLKLDHGERLEPDLTIVAAGAGTGKAMRALAPRLTIVDQTMFYFSARRAFRAAQRDFPHGRMAVRAPCPLQLCPHGRRGPHPGTCRGYRPARLGRYGLQWRRLQAGAAGGGPALAACAGPCGGACMPPPGPDWAMLLARLPQPGPDRATIGLAIDTGPHGADLLRAAAALAGDFPGIGYLWHDDGASAEGGAAAARAMNEQGVRLLIGHFNSASALAAAPLYARAGAVLLAPGATHPALTGAMPNCFRLCAHDLRQARLFAEELTATGETPVLVTQRIPHGKSLGDAVEGRLRAAGHAPLRIDVGHPADVPPLPPGPVAVIGRHAFAAALLPRLTAHPLVLLSDDCRTPSLLDAIAPGIADLRVAAIGGADDAMPGGAQWVGALDDRLHRRGDIGSLLLDRRGGDKAVVDRRKRVALGGIMLGFKMPGRIVLVAALPAAAMHEDDQRRRTGRALCAPYVERLERIAAIGDRFAARDLCPGIGAHALRHAFGDPVAQPLPRLGEWSRHHQACRDECRHGGPSGRKSPRHHRLRHHAVRRVTSLQLSRGCDRAPRCYDKM